MKLALSTLLLVSVFAGVGVFTAHAVLAHSAQHADVYLPETRLAAMMAGLFAGGAATVLAGIALLITRRRNP
jgi:ABC-type enterochelin transport system permease subunit